MKAGSRYSIIYSYLFDAQLQGDDEAKNHFRAHGKAET